MTRLPFHGAIAAIALLAAGPAMSAAKNPMVGVAAMYPTKTVVETPPPPGT